MNVLPQPCYTGDCLICVLNNADLRHTDLAYANLKRADLKGADLSIAKLSGADLSYAIMNGAILCNTTMPDGSVIYSGC